MMHVEEYINSGVLELFVAGALSESENKEVVKTMQKHPEILSEVLKIEASIITLTSAASPRDTKYLFEAVKEKLGLSNSDSKVVSIKSQKNKWISYTGWAAAVILGFGLLWFVNENNTLKSDIKTTETDKEILEVELHKVDDKLADAKKLISVLRDRNIINIPLEGQTVYPEAYATAYWDKENQTVYFDLQGLPNPPEGKVYQIWSLKLTPLTPTSLGTVDDFMLNEEKIFNIKNTHNSEAFGITLEPAGGSKSPTLEQLYTLGAVNTAS